MSSQLLTRLRSAIDCATATADQQSLRAQWAGLMARFGDIGIARAEILALRGENTSYDPRVTAWVLLAEGLVDHFESLGQGALDKFRRAYGIGVAARLHDIQGTSAAWMAASEFLAGSVAAAAEHAVESILISTSDAHSALARAHLVIADCLSCVGDQANAQSQYSVARQHASRDGDISMQSIVLFNAAAFQTARITLAHAFDRDISDDLRTVQLVVDSVANLDAGIAVDSLRSLVPLLKAQLCVAKGDWSEAHARYKLAIPEAQNHGQERWMAKFQADLAYCAIRDGDPRGAVEALGASQQCLSACSDLDDLAITHARLAKTMQLLGMQTESEHNVESANRCLAHFEDQQHRLRGMLAPTLARLCR